VKEIEHEHRGRQLERLTYRSISSSSGSLATRGSSARRWLFRNQPNAANAVAESFDFPFARLKAGFTQSA